MSKIDKKIIYLLSIILILLFISMVILILSDLSFVKIKRDGGHIEYKTFEEIKEETINNLVADDVQNVIREFLNDAWDRKESIVNFKSDLYYSRIDITANNLYVELIEYREAEYKDGGPLMQSVCAPHLINLEKDKKGNWFVSNFDDGCDVVNLYNRNKK